jgi:hypothetical protein
MPGLRPFVITLVTLVGLGCAGGDLTLPGEPSGPAPGPTTSAPTTLTAVAGNDQRAGVGQTLDQPLTVQVLDASARPIAGVQVQFAFEGDGAGGTVDPSSTTDAEGHAEATVRLGDQPGEQTIVAALAATPTLSTRFTVTATKHRGDDHGGGGDHD